MSNNRICKETPFFLPTKENRLRSTATRLNPDKETVCEAETRKLFLEDPWDLSTSKVSSLLEPQRSSDWGGLLWIISPTCCALPLSSSFLMEISHQSSGLVRRQQQTGRPPSSSGLSLLMSFQLRDTVTLFIWRNILPNNALYWTFNPSFIAGRGAALIKDRVEIGLNDLNSKEIRYWDFKASLLPASRPLN